MYSENECGCLERCIIFVFVVAYQIRKSRTTITRFVITVENQAWSSGVHTNLSFAFSLLSFFFFIVFSYLRRVCSSPYLFLVSSFAFRFFSSSSSTSSLFSWLAGAVMNECVRVFVFLRAIDKRLTSSQANTDLSFFDHWRRETSRAVLIGALLLSQLGDIACNSIQIHRWSSIIVECIDRIECKTGRSLFRLSPKSSLDHQIKRRAVKLDPDSKFELAIVATNRLSKCVLPYRSTNVTRSSSSYCLVSLAISPHCLSDSPAHDECDENVVFSSARQNCDTGVRWCR